MKKRFHVIKKVYAIMVLIIFIFLIVLGFSGASYLNQSYKRGVVRNRDKEAIRFTANYLSLVPSTASEDSYAQRIITYKKDAAEPLFCRVDVRNYIPGSTNLINEYTIIYTLQVRFKNATPGKKYAVGEQKCTANDSGDCILDLGQQKLLGRSKNVNTYTIAFYKNDLDRMSITVTAKPEKVAYTGNQVLAAEIFLCTNSETQPFSCVGKFADQTSGMHPSAFDAYNYEIVLANGRAKVTLIWDKDLYEIDPFFKSKLAVGDIKEDSEGKLVFIMDQTKGNDSYRIPFYKKDKDKCNKLSWEEMREKISVSAEELAPQTTNN